MISRLISGLAGPAVVFVALTWPQVLSVPPNVLPGTIAGFLQATGIMLGVYLMFYSMTGDWLPRLTRRRKKD